MSTNSPILLYDDDNDDDDDNNIYPVADPDIPFKGAMN